MSSVPMPLPSSVELVIARYGEHVQWVGNVPSGVRVSLYNKGKTPVPGESASLPNVGREAHTYLHHIVHRYSSLAPVTVFCQGHPFDHASDFHRVVRDLHSGILVIPDFKWIGFIIDTDDPRGRRLFVPWSKNPERSELPLDTLYRELFGKEPPPWFHFHAGGQFAVTAEQVLTRPLSFYQHAMELAATRENAAHGFERIWDHVFGVRGVDPSTLPDGFSAYTKPIRRLMKEG